MNLEVFNGDIEVCQVHIGAITSSSVFLVGDAEIIQLASIFDTPPESLIIGPFVPLNPQG